MQKILVFIFLLTTVTASSQYTMRLAHGDGQFEVLPLIVEVSKELTLRVIAEQPGMASMGSGWWLGHRYTPKAPVWTVNGIVRGNNLVGQITVDKDYPYKVTYKAPKYKPDKNPVEVKAAYKDVQLGGRIFDTTIACQIEVIGEWTIRLDPDTGWVRLNSELPLRIVKEFQSENKIKATTYGTGWWLDSVTFKQPQWTVNGTVNGNNLIGQIIKNGPYNITFRAPIQQPVKNPVEVIAEYKDVYINNKISDRRLTTHIWIVDSDTSLENDEVKNDTMQIRGNVATNRFEVRMVASLIGGSRDAWGGIVTYSDEGSFIVAVEADKAAVTEIKNNLEVLTNNCAKIITNPTTCTGMLHVAGIKSSKVTPANPPGQPDPVVEIWFVPYPTELTRFKFTCPPPPSADRSSIGKIDISQMAMMSMARMPALPPYIKFIAKDEDQIIMEKGSPGSEIYYKFSVRKVKE